MNTHDAAKYLKKLSMPKFDDVLSYASLQRSPSTFSRVMSGVGLIGLGALVGAGLSMWFGSPKNRKQLSTALTNSIDKVSTLVSNGVSTVSTNVGNGVANGKQAARAVIR